MIKILEEHLDYLDILRESGVLNMGGAPAYVQERFNISEKDSSAIFLHWKATFTARQVKKQNKRKQK